MRKVIVGKIYKHFEGELYIVRNIAVDNNDIHKKYVIYESLSNGHNKYIKEYDEFSNLVNHSKYPYIKQIYEFEEYNGYTHTIIDKNIVIIGADKQYRKLLTSKISVEFSYNIVNIDEIIESININDLNKDNFIINYLQKLLDNRNTRYVIESKYIDLDKLVPFFSKNKSKFEVIGLTYSKISYEELIKLTKDNSNWISEEELKNHVDNFIAENKKFEEKINKYKIKTYDVSHDEQFVINNIIKDLKGLEWETNQ